MGMKTALLTGAAGLLVMGSAAVAEITFDSNGLRGDFGKAQLRGTLSGSFQVGAFDPLGPGGSDTETNVDGAARLTFEYTTDNAWVLGVAADIDTGNQELDGLERDEFYVYAASEWGRFELGENDGPGDTLSFHAPTTGMGQVRGDFARYTGSLALLSPYDSQDAAKVTYLSPPVRGFRFGASYAPEFNQNEDDPDPTQRRIQENVYELAGQYVQPVGNWVVGASAAYIGGSANPITQRGDIESWSVGAEARRGPVTFGAAYVDRSQSNLRLTSEERTEWNAGARWNGENWSAASSVAVTDRGAGTISRYAVGGHYDMTENIFIRADAVILEEDLPPTPEEDGNVFLMEVGFRF